MPVKGNFSRYYGRTLNFLVLIYTHMHDETHEININWLPNKNLQKKKQNTEACHWMCTQKMLLLCELPNILPS